jgi:S-DNA-T family DNA segregation ATPase FtsK/SpoIIIE
MAAPHIKDMPSLLPDEPSDKKTAAPRKEGARAATPRNRGQQVATTLSFRLYEAAGLVMLFVCAFVLISLISFNPGDPSFNVAKSVSGKVNNGGGVIGAYLADMLLTYFGAAAYTLAAVLMFWAANLLLHRPIAHFSLRLATIPPLIVALAGLFALAQPFAGWPTIDGPGNGGLVGLLVGATLSRWIGEFGAIFLPSLITFLSFLWLSNLTTHDLYRLAKVVQVRFVQLMRLATRLLADFRKSGQMEIQLPMPAPKYVGFGAAANAPKPKPQVEMPAPVAAPAKRVEEERQTALPLNLSDSYILPPLRLLSETKDTFKPESEDALTQNARQIEAQLANFNVQGTVHRICPGPVITTYELEPAPGVKTSQVVGLADDLARAMSAISVRIAPIPGRNVLGIEMPNAARRTVSLREMLGTEQFETHPGKLTVALGVDSTGNPVYTDISKMPHALIAGTTGSGKSVAMNAFILSLAYRLTPEQLRFIMIDPKMLELSIYNDIPHLLTPVVTDPNKASVALQWAVREMENRYRLMSEFGVKNLQSFNTKFMELKEKGEIPTRMVQTGFDPNTGQPIMSQQPLAKDPMPYIVVVIDELADLMMVAGKQVETSIARLAQMARAAGIHLLVATQRPSVDVVTGLIKANIPTRISFNVTSKIDSRTVLDQMGAEQLLGKGDMLFMGNGAQNLQRVHGAFVTEEECLEVARHLREQGKPSYIENITKNADGAGGGGTGGGTGGDDDLANDPLYHQAIEIVAKEQKASTSFIQRHLQIGYNRAARIIEQMEADGLIGPPNHVGKREVVMQKPPQDGYAG